MSALALAEVLALLACTRPVCTVYARSRSAHVLQLYAGLYMLHAAGLIDLRQRFGAKALAHRLGRPALGGRFVAEDLNGLFVDVEGGRLAFFDVRDGANSYGELADRVAIYAKRSYRRGAFPSPEKFIPMGLNYLVHADRTSWPELARSLAALGRPRHAAKGLLLSLARLYPSLGRLVDVPTVSALSSPVDRRLAPRVIFLVRTWDPHEVPALPAADVHQLNETRAACIRGLRERFGRQFFGGFSRTGYALEHYPDCVVDLEISTRKHDYVLRLRQHSICVATTGLSDSIGWKFAEYVALSRAIVTEPLSFELPGRFEAGENYLEFRSAQECGERTAELFGDPDRARHMMENNSRYYAEYASPDAIVGRVLHAAVMG